MKFMTLSCLTLVLSLPAWGESFRDLTQKLSEHEILISGRAQADSLKEKARTDGSWGDPMVSVSAMNFPRETLDRDQSMMTGIQFGLSQKISLSGKYGRIQESGEEASQSYLAQVKQTEREFLQKLWSLGIQKERLLEEKRVLSENRTWIESHLKITNRLYSTGKVPQQAVLDIQMRKSDLEAQLKEKSFELQALSHELSALFGSVENLDLDIKTIPWTHLDEWKSTSDDNDYKERSLAHALKASDLKASAKKRDFIPDITVGVNYTKRNDIDGIGDFVGAQISIPLPLSDKKYAGKDQAFYQKKALEKKYMNYKKTKPHLLKGLEFGIQNTSNQLQILERETLKYAQSSRDITAKSYSRGRADYLELLRSDLSLFSRTLF